MVRRRLLQVACLILAALPSPSVGAADVEPEVATMLAKRRAQLARSRQRERYDQSLAKQIVVWHLKNPELLRKELDRRRAAKELDLGPHPFGSDADDPFGAESSDDPFGDGSAAPIDEPKVDPQAKFDALVRNWPHEEVPKVKFDFWHIHLLIDSRLSASDGAHFLETQLALAHAAVLFDGERSASLVDIAAALAARGWPHESGEVTLAMLKRLANDSLLDRRAGWVLADAILKYRRHSVAPYPFAWRDASDRWLAWSEALIDASWAKDPTSFWQARIDKNSEDADLYRAAYLGWARVHKNRPFQASIVRPWLEDSRVSPTEQSVRVIATLRTLAARGISPDHAAQRRLRERLDQLISHPRWAWGVDDPRGVDQLALLAAVSPAADNDAVLRRLAAVDREPLEHYSELVDVDSAVRKKVYETLPIRVAWPDESVATVLTGLASKVGLAIWFDRAVVDNEAKLPLEFDGRWRDAFDDAVERAGYATLVLPGDVTWVGSAAARAAAREFFDASAAIASEEPALVRAMLDEPANVQCIETALDDVATMISDRHEIRLHLLGDWKARERPITFNGLGLPLHLALSLMCREHGLAWTAGIDTIAIGAPDKVANFSAAAARYKARLPWLAKLPKTSALHGSTVIEFIETPVFDVLAYFSDLHGMSVVFDGRKLPEMKDGERVPDEFQFPITTNDAGITFAWGLTKALAEHPLDWWTDGEVIYVSDAAGLREFQELAANRAAARRAYPEALRKRLQTPCEVEFTVKPRTKTELFADLGKKTDMTIAFDKSIDDERLRQLVDNNYNHAPLDKALDIVCRELGLTWALERDGSVVIKER